MLLYVEKPNCPVRFTLNMRMSDVIHVCTCMVIPVWPVRTAIGGQWCISQLYVLLMNRGAATKSRISLLQICKDTNTIQVTCNVRYKYGKH